MLWWKVELDKSGAILTCEQVDSVSKGTKLVTYVQATTKAQACTGAKAWYERHRRVRRAAAARERIRTKSQGKCIRCKKSQARPGKGECQKCADIAGQRRKAARNGLIQPRTLLTPEEALRSVNWSHKKSNRKRGLFMTDSRALLNRAAALGDTGPLVQWLIAEQNRRAVEWAAANPEHADIAQAAE